MRLREVIPQRWQPLARRLGDSCRFRAKYRYFEGGEWLDFSFYGNEAEFERMINQVYGKMGAQILD